MARHPPIMEPAAVEILFGSDTYNLPELYWLAARWGKRFLSDALSVYVREGLLTEDEAIEAARMMFYKNDRRVYNLDGPPGSGASSSPAWAIGLKARIVIQRAGAFARTDRRHRVAAARPDPPVSWPKPIRSGSRRATEGDRCGGAP